jgi:hypothetical protein
LPAQRKLDQEVRACLRDSDIEGAATRIMHAWGPGVLGYLRVALADDRSAQDAFTRFSSSVWQCLRRAPSDLTFQVWTYRLAYRSAKEAPLGSRPRRTAGTDRSKPSRLRGLGRTQTATLEPLGVVEDAELMRHELSLEEQTLLTLRLDRQFSWSEIGQVLGRGGRASEPSIQRRFERLIARLHRSAIARGFIAPGAPLPSMKSLQLVPSPSRGSTPRER